MFPSLKAKRNFYEEKNVTYEPLVVLETDEVTIKARLDKIQKLSWHNRKEALNGLDSPYLEKHHRKFFIPSWDFLSVILMDKKIRLHFPDNYYWTDTDCRMISLMKFPPLKGDKEQMFLVCPFEMIYDGSERRNKNTLLKKLLFF